VLKPDASRDAIDDAMRAGSWRLTNVLLGGQARPPQLIFSRAEGSAHAYVIEDARLGVTYLSIQGGDSLAALAQLRRALPCYGPTDHEALVDAPGDAERILGLALVALQVPASEQVDDWLLGGLRDASAQVRAAALTAATYAPRPALLPGLMAIEHGDSEAGLRHAAGQVVSALYTGGPA
jgi:hypothetical protein